MLPSGQVCGQVFLFFGKDLDTAASPVSFVRANLIAEAGQMPLVTVMDSSGC